MLIVPVKFCQANLAWAFDQLIVCRLLVLAQQVLRACRPSHHG